MNKDNIRIAKNTVVVYARLVITSVIGLLTSKYVLQILGASDFGLYAVIGGVIAMFTFISTSLQATTARFVNYEMGRKDGNLNRVFNTARQIHLCFAVVILLIAEIAGVLYIQNCLNVDPAKLDDAYYVFHVSIVAACIGIVNVPYQGLLVAHERFFFVACVDILLSVSKLLMVMVLLYVDGNVLRLYALGMSVLTVFSFIIYMFLCKHYWPSVVKCKLVKSMKRHKEMLIFNNYALLTTASLMGRNQGSNLIINYFFGTIVNAAYAISNTVHVYVNTFAGCFDQASAPQITQSLSRGDLERVHFLVSHTCRICILLVEIIFFTLMADLDFMLNLWLGEDVPEGTVTFCQLTLLLAVVSATSGGLAQFINALGKLKWFTIWMALLYAVGLLTAVALFNSGAAAWTVVSVFILADAINRMIQLLLLRRLNGFPVMQFVSEAYSRPMLVFILGSLMVYVYHQTPILSDYARIVGITMVCLTMTCLVVLLGLKRDERKQIFSIITNKIIRR